MAIKATRGAAIYVAGDSITLDVPNDRFWRILLQKSKIDRPRKSRDSRFLDAATAAKLSTADTRTGSGFCAK
jgi:hypothetical protein